jgi:hypothetical protein
MGHGRADRLRGEDDQFAEVNEKGENDSAKAGQEAGNHVNRKRGARRRAD